jgi:hypothetical protein
MAFLPKILFPDADILLPAAAISFPPDRKGLPPTADSGFYPDVEKFRATPL